ncbi:MAG TPA: periplasmic heavy metal sensor [Pseudolabrys sp.]|jgi:uncharacterized membrane protein|nr:periplasmic heavy metal sensor [Pseudolabrys sp.]
MTMSHALSSPSGITHRALLFGSVALNLFFVGITVALLVRSPAPTPPRNVATRIEQLAQTLPPDDGAKLRGAYLREHTDVNAARAAYEKARDGIRAELRREPFDAAAMADAMSKTRAARQQFDLALQGMIAAAAAEMSPAGRQAMADWPSSRRR